MKVYMDQNCLRMVGKSWQIKAKLKELSYSTLTVQQFLQFSKEQTANERKLHVIKS